MDTDLMKELPSQEKKIVKSIPKKSLGERWKKDIKKNWVIYVIFIPVALYFILFHYVPMVGIVLAFKDYNSVSGIFGSPWVGLENFRDLFSGDGGNFGNVMRNTSMMALLNLTIGFIVPVIFAILLSFIRTKRFKRTVQISSYMPYFIATVVVTQMFREFLDRGGAITTFLTWFGMEDQNLLANEKAPVFWFINCLIDVWQGFGYGAIVYCAAIANVNPNLHEAAAIDGANQWQRLWKVTMPSVLPLIITMLTLRVGLVFTTGFDKVILLYSPAIYDTADCLATYTHRNGILQGNYGLATASGLFQSVIASFLLITSNKLNRKIANTSLF